MPDSTSIQVSPPSVTDPNQANFTITLVGPDKQGKVQVKGKIEPCAAGGGAAGPTEQDFKISRFQSYNGWRRFSIQYPVMEPI